MTVRLHGDAEFQLLEGDVRDCLRGLADGSVDCIVTSPPYFNLRDYGLDPAVWGDPGGCEHEWDAEPARWKEGAKGSDSWKHGHTEKRPDDAGARCRCGAWLGQLGLEPTPELFVEHLVEVFREARRVLAPHGTLWLNIGDSYAREARASQHKPGDEADGTRRAFAVGAGRATMVDLEDSGLKPKDLCLVPQLLAIALQRDGWWVRSEVVWAKPNAFTESVTDRPPREHEQVWLLTKRDAYFYDRFGAREPVAPDGRKATKVLGKAGSFQPRDGERWPDVDKAVRTVWEIATQAFTAAAVGIDDADHYSSFPEELAERCVLLGSPREVCTRCGVPRRRIVERGELVGVDRGGNYAGREEGVPEDVARMAGTEGGYRPGMAYQTRTVGWTDCGCGAGFRPGVVLDPFIGTGTTAVAARRHGRLAVGCEASPASARIALARAASWWRRPPRPRGREDDQMTLLADAG